MSEETLACLDEEKLMSKLLEIKNDIKDVKEIINHSSKLIDHSCSQIYDSKKLLVEIKSDLGEVKSDLGEEKSNLEEPDSDLEKPDFGYMFKLSRKCFDCTREKYKKMVRGVISKIKDGAKNDPFYEKFLEHLENGDIRFKNNVADYLFISEEDYNRRKGITTTTSNTKKSTFCCELQYTYCSSYHTFFLAKSESEYGAYKKFCLEILRLFLYYDVISDSGINYDSSARSIFKYSCSNNLEKISDDFINAYFIDKTYVFSAAILYKYLGTFFMDIFEDIRNVDDDLDDDESVLSLVVEDQDPNR